MMFYAFCHRLYASYNVLRTLADGVGLGRFPSGEPEREHTTEACVLVLRCTPGILRQPPRPVTIAPAAGTGTIPMGRKPLSPEQREKRRASKKNWHEAHREERLADSKRWRAKHRKQRRTYHKHYREKHREQHRAANRRWRESNRDRINEARRLRYRALKEAKQAAKLAAE
jgi:hypothetical protein